MDDLNNHPIYSNCIDFLLVISNISYQYEYIEELSLLKK